MIPPLTQDELHNIPDVQLLLRLRTLGKLAQETASEIEGASAGLYNRRPDWLIRAKEAHAEVKAELLAAQNEAYERLENRKEMKREARDG